MKPGKSVPPLSVRAISLDPQSCLRYGQWQAQGEPLHSSTAEFTWSTAPPERCATASILSPSTSKSEPCTAFSRGECDVVRTRRQYAGSRVFEVDRGVGCTRP